MSIRSTDAFAATDAYSVTAADSDLEFPCRAVYVGGTGDLTVMMASGNTVTFPSVPAGAILPIQCKQIRSTDTTATDLVALR